jgi:Amt family ammonium transporter
MLGIIMLGILASTAVNASGADGLLRGNSRFFFTQLLSVIASSIYAFGFTYLMLKIINKITRVKTSEGEEEQGLDLSLHGETAYEGM